jgi:glycosyltransferase involved in cell wall biosynthesis
MKRNRIRILLVVRWPVGGIRTYLRYVYNNFSPHYYSCTLIAPDVQELQVLLKDLSQHNIRYVGMKENPSILEFTELIMSTARSEKCDIIHSHGITAGLCSIVPAHILHIPHLLTIHDVFTREIFKGASGCLKRIALSVLLPSIKKIHTVSYDAKDNLIKYLPTLKLCNSKVIAILNGIEVERFVLSEGREFRKELGIGENTFLIGFLGRYMSQKGFVYLVDALELLYKKRELRKRPVVLAFGEGAYIREEKTNVERRGLQNVIYFMPFEPNISPILKGLDLVVMPSLWEACGLLAMEAMVSGVPLIGTDCIGLREVLHATPCKIIPARNSEALADAIAIEIGNPSKDHAQKFSRVAAERFDAKVHSDKIERLMASMITH